MKYVILIHANPDPWGHPTSHHTAEGRSLPSELHKEMDRREIGRASCRERVFRTV